MKIFSSFILSFCFIAGFSQTILHQQESIPRTVDGPKNKVAAVEIRANSTVSAPVAVKKLPSGSQGGPVNSTAGENNPYGTYAPSNQSYYDTAGNVDVNSNGQLQFSFHVALPPGLKDVAPRVALNYLSGSSNGIAGYGWNISGVTAISRIGKTLEKDGEVRNIQLDYSDYYSFNGQRLILKSGEYGKDGAEYITEKHSNIKVKSIGSITGKFWKGPEYWEVTFEDGSQAWYGATTTGDSVARNALEYNIVKWRDKKGNYISYNYTQSSNLIFINNMQWGGNEELNKPHFNKIDFYYSQRYVNEYTYIRGLAFVQDKILSTIIVNTDGNIFKSYNINYTSTEPINGDTNNTIKYQFVKSITEGNSINDPANPVLFSSKPLQTSLNESNFVDYTDIVNTGDFNGDGLVDFIVKKPSQGNQPAGYYLYFDAINEGTNFVYLGTDSTLYPGYIGTMVSKTEMHTFNIKPSDNFIKPKQGILTITSKRNIAVPYLPYSYDIELRYFSIKNDASVLNTTNNPLVLEYSKTIAFSDYQYDPSIYPNQPDPGYSYIDEEEVSSFITAKEVDIDSDGLSEIMLSIADTKCYKRELSTYPEDEHRWDCENAGNRFIIVDKDDIANNTFHMTAPMSKNLFLASGVSKSAIMDFDNDGRQDILLVEPNSSFNNVNATFYTKSMINGNVISRSYSTPVNSVSQYEIVKQNDQYEINLKKSFTVKGISSGIQFGDLNGDKNIEILLPLHEYAVNDEYLTGWSIYLNKGNDLDESLQGLTMFKKYVSNATGLYSTTGIIDIDNDGKGEIINSYVFSTYPGNTQTIVWTLDSFSEPYYNIGDSQFKWRFNEKRLLRSERQNSSISPLFGDFRINNTSSKVLFLLKGVNNNERKIISYKHFSLSDKNINYIYQTGIPYQIEYKELDPAINSSIYGTVKKEQYPYLEMDRLAQTFAVSQIKVLNRKQDFRYRGFITHLQGKGSIGFRQVARSSWYADGFENTKVWSGIEIDPLNEGGIVKEWSIRTNNENLIFPTDLSENNNQLLSFKSTGYKIDRLINGQLVTTIPAADKAKVVTAVIPVTTREKNFLNNTITENTIAYNNPYYLPSQTITNVNNGFAVIKNITGYLFNPSGIGKEYYIGRLGGKVVETTAYSSSNRKAEFYAYENNTLKTTTTVMGTDIENSTIEEYKYDGFGNIIEKKLTSNDAQIRIVKSEYDPKGRFLVKKIDNLGLETTFTYDSWGHILTENNPFGNMVENTYDKWGKLLKSKNNLEGTTSYQYTRYDDSNLIIVQYDPDGNISRKFVNKLGQEYKSHTKSGQQNRYVARYTFFDALGRKVRESEPYFDEATEELPFNLQWTVIDYDDSIFPSKATATSLAKVNNQGVMTSFAGKKMETSIVGNTTSIKELNGYGRMTTKTVDALGNISSTTDKGGTVTFSYNAAGDQIKAQYGQNTVTAAFDDWSRKIEFNDPSNGIYKYEYDGFGQLKKIISPKGTKEYIYNHLGQLTTQLESSSDGGQTTNKTMAYGYDAKGRVVSKTGISKGKAFSSNIIYDAQGRILSTSENSNDKLYTMKDIAYDDKDRIISYQKSIQSSGVLTKVSIENVYSTWNGDLYQAKEKDTGKILWDLQTVNERGDIVKSKLGSAEINNSYDPITGYLTKTNHSSQAKPGILDIYYTFNAIQNELVNRKTLGDFNIIESFVYDDNNRLTQWTNPITGQNSQNVYDVKGRILQNDQMGAVKFENSSKIYQPTGMTLNAAGEQNYANDLIQTILYNENNDPVFIDGEKGDVAFQYGLTSMRQRVTYGGNFNNDADGKFTKFYSEDGSYEILKDNTTGKEKHILYIGGTPYESNMVYIKNFDEANGAFKFLHKDYLGSILAISDEAGNKLEQRHFDAWGNFTHLQIASGAVMTDKNSINNAFLIVDRGYTSHEHFGEVGLIHMNGRLYDPLLRRFLNADENIQDIFNTQNYNKYGYVMNNPLMYSDPSGEVIVLGGLLAGAIIGAIKAVMVSAIVYMVKAVITGEASKAGFLKTMLGAAVSGAVGGALSGAVGSVPSAGTLQEFSSMLFSQFLSSMNISWNFSIGDFDFSISPSIVLGKGNGFGANVSTTYHSGDFAISAGYGIMNYSNHAGSGLKGWEHRTSIMAGTLGTKGNLGFMLGTNMWSGLHSQRTGIVRLQSGDFSMTYENDGSPFGKLGLGDNNDSWRSAAMTMSIGDFTTGFNLFTGERSKKTYEEGTKDNPGYDIKSGKARSVDAETIQNVKANGNTGNSGAYGERYRWGLVKETGSRFRLGAVYVGWKNMRTGLDSEWLRHGVQNTFAHKWLSPQPAFQMLSNDWKPYNQSYQSRNVFTSW